jgi:hypothetical protein
MAGGFGDGHPLFKIEELFHCGTSSSNHSEVDGFHDGCADKNTIILIYSMLYGGESVSQSPLKDQAFSTFLDQNPLFELPPENGFSPSTKACPTQWPVVDNSATKRLAKGKLPSHR